MREVPETPPTGTESRHIPELGVDDFARRFALRASSLMWFLGAGASASGGIPTAFDMIWEFKQQLFISQRRVSPNLVSDLSSPAIRAQLQAHIDSLATLPPAGAPEEYARLFETVYPAESDRRAFVEAKVSGAKPSYGHMALATLMHAHRAPLAWTTNFDTLIADACAKVYDSTGALTSVGLDAPELAVQRIQESRWPIEIKLHGDFRSRRLKNTSDELRLQDARMRHLLVACCGRFGMIVVGYSGRDDSVMDTFEEALQSKGTFPNGLFWLHRGADEPLERVSRLLARAQSIGIEACLVRIENFDEVMRDLLRLAKGIDTRALGAFAAERRWRSEASRPSGKRGWPVVRLNALPVQRYPSVCRRIVCQIGGFSEVREAVEKVGVNILATRIREAVLAYGADCDVRSAFEAHSISDFDLYSIEVKRLRHDSGERGLLRAALSRAIARSRCLEHQRRRNTDLFAPIDPNAAVWEPLARLVSPLTGAVTGFPTLRWSEGIGTRLDWADEQLWLLIEPRIVFEGITDENRAAASDFARERTVRRYNRQLNDLTECWATLLSRGGDELRALGISDGVDATFLLSRDTAFSRRIGA